MALAVAVRLVPIAASEVAAVRDGTQHTASAPTSIANLIDTSGQTFPGSAYFFAEGAFGPAPGTNGLPERWRGNKHILAIDIGPAATSYRFAGRSAVDRMRALSCLTNAIYYEAANEPEEGQRAVAQVILNRLRHPEWPNTICGVVYQGTERDDLRCQFSFSCDGSMARMPSGANWIRARRVAEAALRGDVFQPAGLATFYHTLTVFPGWASRMHASAIIGAHIFYRTPGASGGPGQFRNAYAGIETINGPSANAYLDRRDNLAIAPPIAPMAIGNDAIAPLVTAPAAPSAPKARQASGGATGGLPQSGDIKPEYRNSGRPLDRL